MGHAVGQHDHVLDLRRTLAKRQEGLFHGRIHVGSASGRNRVDATEHELLVGAGLDFGNPLAVVLKGNDADLILRLQQSHRAPRGFLGQLDGPALFHRARAIDHQHQGQGWAIGLFVELGPDGQDFLQRGASIPARREGPVAAHRNQSAAEVADIVVHGFHLPIRERRGRHVRQHQQVVLPEAGKRVGNLFRLAHVEVDLLASQGPGKRPHRVEVAFDQQHARPRHGEDHGPAPVVLGNRVAKA